MVYRILFYVLITVMLLTSAHAAERVALVIGNGGYSHAPLRNPVNDARDMANTLTALGFEVQRHSDLDENQMHRAIRRFGKALARAEIGLFYYAGHGIQVGGGNYLIPIGADIEQEDEVRYKSIDAGQVLAKMESAHNPVNILIFDACRNNPLAGSFRSASHGLARMQSPVGSLVLYATAHGKTAADGPGRNGVFTKHLMKQLQRPGLSLREVVLHTRVAVMSETAKQRVQQVPWESSSLTRKVILNAGSEDCWSRRGRGKVCSESATGMEFVWMPGGCYWMGQSSEEKRRLIHEYGEEEIKKYFKDELPRHEVCVDGFWMARDGRCRNARTVSSTRNAIRFHGTIHSLPTAAYRYILSFIL